LEHVENAAKEEEACIKRERCKRERMRRNGIIFPHKNCPCRERREMPSATKKNESKSSKGGDTDVEVKEKKLLPRNYHLKKSLKKKLEILEKYERLKAAGAGKLEKELQKRRKRLSQKGQKFMPRTRR
jgi:hypothetical protein